LGRFGPFGRFVVCVIVLIMNRITLFDIPFDNLTMDEAVKAAIKLASGHRHPPHYIATINVDFLVNCYGWNASKPQNPELLNILKASSLNFVDGMPLVWLSKLKGTPLKERVAGATFLPLFLKACAEQNKSIYILGGEPPVIAKAIDILKQHTPQLHIVGTDAPKITLSPYTPPSDDLPIVERINSKRPDVLLLALGNPKQELWFQRVKELLTPPLVIGVGGSLNFVAKAVPRAPLWMQNAGLEWLFRLYQEPGRLWKRYVKDLCQFATLSISLLFKRKDSDLK
jgi:N-acetylglucosaminyldiphosphoundecaprenol N-acetyl-beta-D-mannosaminyltransferase